MTPTAGISPLGNSRAKAQDGHVPPQERTAKTESNCQSSPNDTDANSTHENPSPIPSDFADLARAFLDAAEAIERCGSEATDGATPSQRQTATLKRWAEERSLVIPQERLRELALVSNSTSEHEVRFDEPRQRAVKKTWAGSGTTSPIGAFIRFARIQSPRRMSLLEKAISIAVEAHRGQQDKTGAPYILHPLSVMARVDGETEKVVAVLHDVVEDTAWTLEKLKGEGFPDDVLTALDGVTKREGESYEDFVKRSGTNPVARRVKLADLEDNMDLRRLKTVEQKDIDRLARYLSAWRYLKGI